MGDIKELLGLLAELDDQLTACMRCGMCQAVCPIYAQTGRETMVARGKIALVQGLAQEMIKDPAGVEQRINACLLCGACAANCPSGVKVLDIFLKARAILAGYRGLSPVKRALFRGLMTRPKTFNTVLSLAPRFQGIFTKPVNDFLGSSCARFQTSLIGERHFFKLADKRLFAQTGPVDQAAGDSGFKVAFFPGCLVDKVFPDVGRDALKVLDKSGVGVFMPADQACCGIPALSSGDRQAFEAMVAVNLKLFDPDAFDALITPCATCTSTIKKLWPMMGGGMPQNQQDRIGRLAEKTMDISQFLVDRLDLTPPPAGEGPRVKVACHDPCHLKKSLGVAEQPRRILAMNPAYELTEMAEADACCGCGGSFTIQHYDLSKKIGEKKRQNIAAVSPEVVAAGCPACMIQIGDQLSQAGDRIRVKHPIQIYAESL